MEVTNWPIVFLAIAFSFALALSGYHKYLGGWANLDLLAVKQWFIRNHIVVQREYLLGPYFLTFESYTFWKSLDYLTIIFEVGILAGILFPKLFRLFLLATVGFHTANLLMLNIDFSFNFAFYALFLPWARIQHGLESLKNWPTITSRWLRTKSFFIESTRFLIFFALTESSILIFLLNLIGIDYLGNAVVRTFGGIAVVLWLIYDFLKARIAHRQESKELTAGHDSQPLNIS